jgi:hypothetical protein
VKAPQLATSCGSKSGIFSSVNELKVGNVGCIPRGHDLSADHTPCGVALTVRTPRIRQCIKRSATRVKEAAAFWDRPDKAHGGLPQPFGKGWAGSGHSTKDAIALKIQKPKNAVHAALSPNPQIRPVIRNTEDINPHSSSRPATTALALFSSANSGGNHEAGKADG